MSVTWTLPFNLQNGQTADATQVMANFNAGVAALQNAAASGVNSDITALTALSVPITPLQGGTASYWGGVSTGTNAIILSSLTPSGFSLTAGRSVSFIAAFANSGPTTLNVNGLGAKNVNRMTPTGEQPCTGGEIQSSNIVTVLYDGTEFQILTPTAQFGGYGNQTTIAAAGTVDLGTVGSHNAFVSGSATITSFGSSASTTYPFYNVIFSGVCTLVNSSTLFCPGAADLVTANMDTAILAYAGAGIWFIFYYQRAASPPYRRKAPTYQVLTSGSSATYTTPSPTPTYLKIRAVGGGGGGGTAAGGATSGTGGTTSFNSITAVGGAFGAIMQAAAGGQAGGAGGTGGVGTANLRIAGQSGGSAMSVGGASTDGGGGGAGGGTPFGGGGPANGIEAPAANTGAGGGGLQGSVPGRGGAGGGGGGEYFELIIDNPAATYTYTVGAGGTSSSIAGAAGRIIVEEFYN